MATDASDAGLLHAIVVLNLRAFYIDGEGWITTTGALHVGTCRDLWYPGKRILATLRPKGSKFYRPAITFCEKVGKSHES